MARRIHFFASIAAILVILQVCSCRCPLPCDRNVVDVNLSQLAGRWYAVAASPIRQNVGKCLYFDISVDENFFSMKFISSNPSTNRSIEWSATGCKSESEIMSYWQMSGSQNVYGPFVQKTLAMVTEDFCAMIICTDDNPKKYRASFGMIWSRKKTMSDTQLRRLKAEVAEYIDENDIKDIENSCLNM